MSRLQLRLLGVPEVRLDGQPVNLTRRSAIALLAYLAVAGGMLPRELLTALFGGDGSEDQARKRLSNALADLRQQIGQCLLSSWHAVGLRPEVESSLDIAQFEQLLTRARNEGDATALRAAAELYEGDFMAGLSVTGAPDFEMWLKAHRESYHAQFVQALEGVTDSAVQRAAWEDGAWAAQRLVELEPCHEGAHRQLMLTLARSGQRDVALAQYEICRRVLREELDTEPSPETRAVYEMLNRSPTLANNLPVPATACVGREAEMDVLADRLAAQESRLITIVGPAGSGKTRLALEAAARFTRTDPLNADQPFSDGVFVVHANAQSTDLLGNAVARTVGLEVGDGGNPLPFPRLLELLERQQLLLILDGVEHCPSTTGLLNALLASAPGLTLVVTAREAIGIDGEHILCITGLPLPERADDLAETPASALLLAEARRADMYFKFAPEAGMAIVRLCQLLRGLPLGLLLAGRALSETAPHALVGTLEAALAALRNNQRLPASFDTPPWLAALETVRSLDQAGAGNGASSTAVKAKRATPLAVVCTLEAEAASLVQRLKQEGMLVCVTHELLGCLRVATAVGPDLVLLDRRLPQRLEELLRAHPTSRHASIRWLGESAEAQALAAGVGLAAG